MNSDIKIKLAQQLISILKKNKNNLTVKFTDDIIKGIYLKDITIVLDSDDYMFVYQDIGPKRTTINTREYDEFCSRGPHPQILNECSDYELLFDLELNDGHIMINTELNSILDSIIYSETVRKLEHLQESPEDSK